MEVLGFVIICISGPLTVATTGKWFVSWFCEGVGARALLLPKAEISLVLWWLFPNYN